MKSIAYWELYNNYLIVQYVHKGREEQLLIDQTI